MLTISANSVDEAIYTATLHLRCSGRKVTSRNGPVLELPYPLCTEYYFPDRRCVFYEERNWNCFFAMFESLWILAGRDDVAFLERFNKQMVQFSDDGMTFHAPYGYRLRSAFGMDQLNMVADVLKKDPDSRRAVATIWCPMRDLGRNKRDHPCNDLLFFKIREGKLLLTVCCRSNDMILGAYNVNQFQFSMIQEYVAGKLGVEVGHYHHISDSFHVYTEGPYYKEIIENDKLFPNGVYENWVVESTPIFMDCTPEEWDEDLKSFFNIYDRRFNNEQSDICHMADAQFKTYFFNMIVRPMYISHHWHKFGNDTEKAIETARLIGATDYRLACTNWLKRRLPNE